MSVVIIGSKPKKPKKRLVDVNAGAKIDNPALLSFNQVIEAPEYDSIMFVNDITAARYGAEIDPKTDFKHYDLQVGVWRWNNGRDCNPDGEYSPLDEGLSRLIEIDPSDERLIIVGTKIGKEEKAMRMARSRAYLESLKDGDKFPPLEGFTDESGLIYLIDGHHRLFGADQAGIKVRIWVEELRDGRTVPWKQLVLEAQSAGVSVNPELTDKLESFGRTYNNPKYRMTYVERRKSTYPALGEQVEALLEAADGDDTKLKAILAQIKAVKSRFPKE